MTDTLTLEKRCLAESLLKGFTQEHYSGGVNTAPEGRMLLLALAISLRAKKIVELGFDAGFTTEALACSGADIFALDSGPQAGTMERLGQWTNIHPLVCDALVYLGSLETDSIDLIFVDDDHTLAHVQAETAQVRRVVRPGGIAVFHDVRYFPAFWPMLTAELRGWECISLPAIANNVQLGIIDFGLGVFRKPG